jgi:uncharacterized protein YjiS (DUF1127 family)
LARNALVTKAGMAMLAEIFTLRLEAPSKNVDAALRLQAKAKACIAEWRQRARSRRELMALDGRELQDIHLTRCDAMSEAGKPFWKE